MMTRLIAATAILIGLAAPTAQAADGAADALVARGLELRREGKQAEALELFQRAHALAPSPRTLGQMGLVETSLKLWLDAETHLDASLATPTDPWVRKTTPLLDEALTLAHQHIGHVSVTGPAGAHVSIAGKDAGTLPLPAPIRVAEGTVLLTALAPGYKQLIQSVTVEGGAAVAVDLAMQPIEMRAPPSAPEAPPKAPSPPAPREAWRSWTAGSLLVAGAAAITWGAIWIAVDGNDHGADSAGRPLVYNTKTPGWIILGAGAAAAAAGGVVLLTAHRGDGEVALSALPGNLVLSRAV